VKSEDTTIINFQGPNAECQTQKSKSQFPKQLKNQHP